MELYKSSTCAHNVCLGLFVFPTRPHPSFLGLCIALVLRFVLFGPGHSFPYFFSPSCTFTCERGKKTVSCVHQGLLIMALWKMFESIIGSNIALPVILHVKRNVWADSALKGHHSEHNIMMIKWMALNEEWWHLQLSDCCV